MLEFKIEKGHVSTNGIGYKALIVQSKDRNSTKTIQLLTELADIGLPIFIVGNNKLEPKFMVDLMAMDTFSETVYKLLSEENVYQVNMFSDLLESLLSNFPMQSVADFFLAVGLTPIFTAMFNATDYSKWRRSHYRFPTKVFREL